MKRMVSGVVVVAALVVSAGVSWSAPPKAKADAPGAVAPSKAAAGGAAANAACALVTKAEAEAILGEPLDELTSGSDTSCNYGHKPNKPHIFMTELRTGETKATFEAQTQNAAKAMGAKLKPVAGYGEQAVWIGTFQIIVLQHGKAISVAQPGDKVAPAKLEAFLRKALARM